MLKPLRRIATLLLMALVASAALSPEWRAAAAASQPVAPKGRHIKPVQLDPASRPTSAPAEIAGLLKAGPGASIDWGDWAYRVEKAEPRDGVPWKLIATPLSQLSQRLRPMSQFDSSALSRSIPVVKVPEVLWPQWFEKDLIDVVGIHYHEFVNDEQARLLITLHKVPPDGPDGRPPADYKGRGGTRIEATLLTPMTVLLDQTIVVRSGKAAVRTVKKEGGQGGARKPQLRTKKTEPPPEATEESRTLHERGHAQLSLDIIHAALSGPTTWNLAECTGQRAHVVWYWDTEKTPRAWHGYHGGSGKLTAQRTRITIAPPTRWSMLVPLPPDEVSQRQIEAFNDWIVHADARLNATDLAAQEKFHALHGAFEAAPEP